MRNRFGEAMVWIYPPSSKVLRFLLGTRYVRHYARKFIKLYRTQTDDGIIIYVRTSSEDWLIMKEIFKERVYEKYFAAAEGFAVVDVGAYSGFFTLKASKLVGNSGHVFAFEPFSKSFSLLERHLQMNNCVNVNAMRLALGSRPGIGHLHVCNKPGNNSLYDKMAFYSRNSC
jgi:hypothetical protein